MIETFGDAHERRQVVRAQVDEALLAMLRAARAGGHPCPDLGFVRTLAQGHLPPVLGPERSETMQATVAQAHANFYGEGVWRAAVGGSVLAGPWRETPGGIEALRTLGRMLRAALFQMALDSIASRVAPLDLAAAVEQVFGRRATTAWLHDREWPREGELRACTPARARARVREAKRLARRKRRRRAQGS